MNPTRAEAKAAVHEASEVDAEPMEPMRAIPMLVHDAHRDMARVEEEMGHLEDRLACILPPARTERSPDWLTCGGTTRVPEHTSSECVPWTSPDSDHRGCYTNGNGVAWRLVGVGCSPLTAGQVRAVMVGDDRVVVFDLDNLAPLADEDYCHECGQIGCTADGR